MARQRLKLASVGATRSARRGPRCAPRSAGTGRRELLIRHPENCPRAHLRRADEAIEVALSDRRIDQQMKTPAALSQADPVLPPRHRFGSWACGSPGCRCRRSVGTRFSFTSGHLRDRLPATDELRTEQKIHAPVGMISRAEPCGSQAIDKVAGALRLASAAGWHALAR